MKETTRFEDVTAIRETPKALLVRIEDETYWVPKVAIDDDSEVYGATDEGTLVVALWWAEKAGIGP